MLEIPLHAGTEHPNFTLIVLSSILAFFAGLGAGTYRSRLRAFFSTRSAESAE